jgi:hypothetical protein
VLHTKWERWLCIYVNFARVDFPYLAVADLQGDGRTSPRARRVRVPTGPAVEKIFSALKAQRLAGQCGDVNEHTKKNPFGLPVGLGQSGPIIHPIYVFFYLNKSKGSRSPQ